MAAVKNVSADDVLLALLAKLNERRTRGIDMFRKIDASGDGSVSVAEFRGGLVGMEFTPSEEILAILMSTLDKDGSGDVSLKEFDRALRDAEKLAKAEGRTMEEAAAKIGLNMAGPTTVSKATLARRSRASMLLQTPTKQKSKVQPMDRIDNIMLNVVNVLNEKKCRVIDYFRKWDRSGDGSISVEEFQKGLAELDCKPSESDFNAIVARLDKDGSGDVSVQEFDKALKLVERQAKKHGPSADDFGSGEIGNDDIVFASREVATLVLPSAQKGTDSDRDTSWRRALTGRPPKKPAARPVTKGSAPRMCRPPLAADPLEDHEAIFGSDADCGGLALQHSARSTYSIGSVVVHQLLSPRQPSAPLGTSQASSLPAPLEEKQRIEWRLRNISMDQKSRQVKYHNVVIHPGKCITSQGVSVAGVHGNLRFWPHGYLNTSQNSSLRREIDLDGIQTDSWCAVGLFMPPGTHLRLRFFVGGSRSGIRDCYWGDGSMVHQIWMPDAAVPPAALDDLIVGVEVLWNHRHLRPGEGQTHKASVAVVASPRAPPKRSALPIMADAKTSQAAADRPMDELSTLLAARGSAGLALPSPRFMCGAELKRKIVPPISTPRKIVDRAAA